MTSTLRRSAIVLAGGRSTRMGRDKASLPWGDHGGTLLGRVVRVLEDVVDEVVVVARADQDFSDLPANVRIAHDTIEDQGPLGGLVAGLATTDASAIYVSGCDTPWLRRAFVAALFEAQPAGGIAVAASDGFAHPLAAVYPTGLADDIAALLAAGRRRATDLLELRACVRVEGEALRAVDPDLVSLENLNDATHWRAALLRDVVPDVRIEFSPRARRLAGCAFAWVPGRTPRQALAAAVRRWPSLVPSVLASDGRPLRAGSVQLDSGMVVQDLDMPLADGTTLLLVDAPDA